MSSPLLTSIDLAGRRRVRIGLLLRTGRRNPRWLLLNSLSKQQEALQNLLHRRAGTFHALLKELLSTASLGASSSDL